METNIQRLSDHAQQLALAFGVIIQFNPGLKPDEACATWVVHPTLGKLSVVIAPPIVDETSYAVVLHEMGHHLSAFGNLRNDLKARVPKPGSHPRERHSWAALQIEEETAAWDWAQHYALEWTHAMQMVRDYCFATYEEMRRRVR